MNGSFGGRIKNLREAMELSLRDLAERSGVSAPMLSQVERGETSPTLAIAARIAAGLELSLSAAAAPRRGRRREHRARRTSAARGARRGHRYEVLTPPLPGQRAEVSVHTLARRRRDRRAPTIRRCTSPAAARPPWSTGGPVRLVCDGTSHDLDEGDAVTFDADLPHHFENPGDEEARFSRSSPPA